MKYLSSFVLVIIIISSCTQTEPLDVLILNGSVIDGTGESGFIANIGIRGDTIVFVEAGRIEEAKKVIDASGFVVAPGFIDPHTHAVGDLSDSVRNKNINYLTQGVTTVFVGNDGSSSLDLSKQFERWEDQGVGTNVASYVGHGTVRKSVMGMWDKKPDMEEMASMKTLVRKAMEAGALGLSSGLYYAPASYAETDEVIELARVVAKFGGVYDVHIRDESSYSIGLLGAIAETIQIAEVAGIPGHIAHIKCLGVDVWGKSQSVIELVNSARERGVSVTADQYPYEASGTSITGALIPRWFLTDGKSYDEKLKDPVTKRRLVADMEENLRRRGGPAKLLITRPNKEQLDLKGKTLEQAAGEWNLDPVEAAIKIFQAGGAGVGSYNMQEEDIQNFMRQPWVMTGSDGSGGHPRKYGSFPRKIGDYVLKKKVLTIEEMIRRSSALPAQTFGIQRRGLIQPGYFADIIIFKPEDVKDNATFENPEELSDGIYYVLVNGQMSIERGIPLENLAGKVLRRKQ